jgi:hypothetical protein
MSVEPLVAQTVAPANSFLWAVKSYLELISSDGQLTPGSGLKRLYVMSSGVTTFNDKDIEALTQKAEEEKMIPNLRGFMNQAITKNLHLYGMELQRIIAERVSDISNGVISNPPSFVTFNADEARRFFYAPPATFLVRLSKALDNDGSMHDYNFTSTGPLVTSLRDVAFDADLLLDQLQGQEGYASPTETSWGALMKLVNALMDRLEMEARYTGVEATYKNRPRSCVKILWVIAKLVMGDLTVNPQRRDINLIDLDQTINLSDGTLAAIPFPLRQTVDLFADTDVKGLSMRARTYLSAVSAAAFYRTLDEDC